MNKKRDKKELAAIEMEPFMALFFYSFIFRLNKKSLYFLCYVRSYEFSFRLNFIIAKKKKIIKKFVNMLDKHFGSLVEVIG